MILLYSVALLGIMGLILAAILAYASKRFDVFVDPKIGEIEAVLPNLNCGACGYAGCHAYAEAIASGGEINLCKPGGKKVAAKISELMHKATSDKEEMVAQRYCNSGSKDKFEYKGVKTCRAASLVNNGFKECSYSCLGLGDCERVCPTNAIKIKDNLPEIDKEKCIACEMCVKECPKNILYLAPKKSKVHVRCRSHDPGKIVVKVCSVGCIGCGVCEKNCPFDAIHVIDNLAVIDYSKCKNCGKCVKVCPRKIIEIEPMEKKG